ncbi:hypothetical protein BN137_295 [Cronobacter condimenti 1330]|uniref:Uncharacterized protein n=1 Tax=Cronobacter condimenti 1330 TaxID=1073999 RepID=K7ZY90_9ENTR|nr:hypothetical protein BN137_295 [Cronobacter condimenti 1330]
MVNGADVNKRDLSSQMVNIDGFCYNGELLLINQYERLKYLYKQLFKTSRQALSGCFIYKNHKTVECEEAAIEARLRIMSGEG